MMTFSFLKLLNNIRTGWRLKKRRIVVNYSKQNLFFSYFLKNRGLITSVTKHQEKLTIELSYDFNFNPSLVMASIVSKTTHQRPLKKSKTIKTKNFIMNLVSTKHTYTKLLARFR
jgi:ribosomal protein S8